MVSTAIHCISVSTRINPTGCLHKLAQPTVRLLGTSDITQRSRPLADRFVFHVATTGAPNNCCKSLRVPVEREIGKAERVSQQSGGPKDEARPIAANVVKSPELLSHKTPQRQFILGINIDCIAR
jgi:hypothetical protein